MIFAASSHRGAVRKSNQDSYYVSTKRLDGYYVMMVADGMGGHRAGEVASAMAVSATTEYLEDCRRGSMETRLRRAVEKANGEIFRRASLDENCQGMGTTLTLALMDEERYAVGHVGDSRAYLISGGEMRQITRDHTLVEEMSSTVDLDEAARRNHPQRSLITRAVGVEFRVDMDLYEGKWQRGDVLFICSDGLVNEVDETEILAELGRQPSLDAWVKTLVERAIEAGGHDNITAVAALNEGGDGL